MRTRPFAVAHLGWVLCLALITGVSDVYHAFQPVSQAELVGGSPTIRRSNELATILCNGVQYANPVAPVLDNDPISTTAEASSTSIRQCN